MVEWFEWLRRKIEEFYEILARIPTPYTPPKGYIKVGELEDLSEFTNPDERLIRSDILKDVARKLAKYDERGELDVERTLKEIVKWIDKNFEYDIVHANASRNWRALAYTYLNADETVRLGRGICGELSQVVVKLARELGLRASLVRPQISHLAVLVEDPKTGKRWLVDPTYGLVRRVRSKIKLSRYAKSKKSKYVVGVITLDEFNKTTVGKRKKLGHKTVRRLRLKGRGEKLTPEEAFDLEYVFHCLKPIFNTKLGREMLIEVQKNGYCRRIFDEKSELHTALTFGDLVSSRCGRYRRSSDYLECVSKVWDELEKSKKEYEEFIRTVLEEWY